MGPSIYVMGDVHGQGEKLRAVLHGTGLIREDDGWSGGDTILCFMGDLVDRGPDGIAVIDLVMRLQCEAEEAGGAVPTLLGNHEVTLLSARLWGDTPSTGPGRTFRADWQRNGGRSEDLEALEDRHVEWLLELPAMMHLADRLMIHADSVLYERYGQTEEEVNDALRALLRHGDAVAWDRLLGEFSQRREFEKVDVARRMLERYGGVQIVHGHSPIAGAKGLAATQVNGPLIYADGLCVNVDGGMYLGGSGFLYQLPAYLTPVESESGTSAMV